MKRMNDGERKNTEQTFDLFCTFFILNDILDK